MLRWVVCCGAVWGLPLADISVVIYALCGVGLLVVRNKAALLTDAIPASFLLRKGRLHPLRCNFDEMLSISALLGGCLPPPPSLLCAGSTSSRLDTHR
jgi:hypothetical protein